MLHAQGDLGRRMIQAARIAVAMHQLADAREREFAQQVEIIREREIFATHGRRSTTATGRLSRVTDDTPSPAIPSRTPWTRTGEDPARSFFR
jgi:hypothetical protein